MMFLQTGPESVSLVEAIDIISISLLFVHPEGNYIQRMLRSSRRLVLAQAEPELPSRPFRRPPARRPARRPSDSVSSLELQQEISPTVHWLLASSRAADSDS